MGDFEDRVGRALGAGAEGAPAAHGLADGARRRLRARRRRLAVAGVAAAVVAVVVPLAVFGQDGGDHNVSDTVPPADSPEPDAADIEVSCVGWVSWPVSAMVEGIPNDVEEADVRDAFVRLQAAPGIDAPRAIQEQGADAAPYIVLAVSDRVTVVGVGEWTSDGPQADAQIVELKQTSSGLKAVGWGDCRELTVALPEGRSRVEVTAPAGGVDPTTTSPQVLVHEGACTSGRDPRAHLGEPQVTETEGGVHVTLSSQAFDGAATCVGNPRVPLTLHLDEPLGDRQLYDAGTWPPTPIRVARADEQWQTVAQDHARAELPPGWHKVECGSDGGEHPVFGPTDVDPCEFGAYAAFYGGATYDALQFPGVVTRSEEDGEVRWSGYVYAGDWVLSAASPDRDLTLRILASARTDGQPVVVADRWEAGADGGVEWRYPAGWGVGGSGIDPTYGVEVSARPGGQRVEHSLAEQLDQAHVRMYGDVGTHRITVTAPSRAVAELVLSSVVAAEG